MRIVINALQIRSNGSGIAVCMRELFTPLARICHQSIQIIVPRGGSGFFPTRDAELVEMPFRYSEGLKRILFQSFALGNRYCRNAVLLTVDSKVPLLIPGSCRLLPLVTDLAVFRMPSVYLRTRVLLWRMQYRLLRRRAGRFLAVSEFTKREITDILGVPASRIDVIPCAASDEIRQVTDVQTLCRVREKHNLPERYVLFVGNYNPRKNLERLIRAFDRVRRNTALPHELVIAGGQGWKFDAGQALKKVTAKDAIHFIGYVADEEMPALYSGADLFVFPTLYEGFGIPVLEAQQCGVPVLTSDISALPETGGDGALYVDPYDEEAIADGIVKLLTDESLRKELTQKGFRNAERYSWEASAEKLDKILERYAE